MPALDVSKSPNLLDNENRLSTTFLTNFLLRPNPQSQSGYVLESFPGLKKTDELTGFSRGAAYNYSKNATYRVVGDKLYKEDSSLVEQVTIPNQDRVRLASTNLNQVVVSGGAAYYWTGSQLNQLQNWSAGENNAPPDGTSFDLSNISDCTRHRDFFLYVKSDKSGFLKTSPFREDRPDATAFVNGNVAEDENDTAIGITVLDGRALLLSKRTARFYTFTTAGRYVEAQNIRVEFGTASRESYCSWSENEICVAGSVTNQETQSQTGIYKLANGGVQPIHTAEILKEIAEYGSLDIQLEKIEYNGYKLLLMKLGSFKTFVYIENVKKWVQLATSKYNTQYQAIDFIENTSKSKLTCASHLSSKLFEFDLSSVFQDGDIAIHRLPLPTIYKNPKMQRLMINSMEFEVTSNESVLIQSLKISRCIDGINYINGSWMDYTKPYDLLKQPRFRKFGNVTTMQGASFMFDFLPITNVNISGVNYD